MQCGVKNLRYFSEVSLDAIQIDSRGLLGIPASAAGLSSPSLLRGSSTMEQQQPPPPVCLLQPPSPQPQQLPTAAGSFDQQLSQPPPQQQQHHLVQRGVSVGVSDRLVVATAQSSSLQTTLPPLHSQMSRHLAALGRTTGGATSSLLISPTLTRERIQVRIVISGLLWWLE